MELRIRQSIALVAAILLLTACRTAKEDAVASTAADLVIRPTAIALRAGETVQLAAQVNDARGRPVGGAPLMFSAGSASVARISSNGIVSAVGTAGSDSILVSSGAIVRSVLVTVSAGPARVIDVVSGGGQSGLAGASLTYPVVIAVHDAYGNPVPRASVQLTAEAGGKTEPPVITTDVSGIARAMWTLGAIAGPQALQVMADSASVIVEATAHAGAMARVENAGDVARRTRAGDTVSVRLRATDEYGNGVSSTIFAFSVETGGGSVVPARIESDSSGIVQTTWRTGTASGMNALRVRAFEVFDTTFQLTVRTTGGPPTEVRLVSGDNQRARSGAAVPRAPVIRLVDRFGNPVEAVRVRFLAGAGDTVEPPEIVTDERGQGSPRLWTLGEAGTHELKVVADGVADTLRVRARATSR